MNDAKLMGRFGEAAAGEYLRKKGYRLLGLNYRTRLGEIDLIASKDGYVVFAEVKARRSADFAQAREFVTPAKQRRIMAAAQAWLQKESCTLQPRFDVIEVYAPEGIRTKDPVIRHWENAFSSD